MQLRFQYTLASVSEGAIEVGIDIPGEHWKVEFMDDGDIEVEIFKGDGQTFDYSIVDELFDDDNDDSGRRRLSRRVDWRVDWRP